MNEKMKQELKEYVYMIAFDGWKDATDDSVMQAIDDFFQSYQPERSKREDLPKWACRAVMMPNGLCHFEDGTIIDSQQPIDEGCGALNSMET